MGFRAARYLSVLAMAGALGACAASNTSIRQRAVLLVNAGDLNAAETLLRSALVGKAAVQERRLLIRVLAFEGQLGKAEHEAALLARWLEPSSPIPWVELGHAHELVHRFDAALAWYDRAAALAPQDPLGPLTGGLRAARWGEAGLAEPRLVEALRRDPSNASAWHALGLARFALGDVPGARAAYASGLVANPAALENRLGLASVAVAVGDAKAALAQYDALLAQRPRFGDAYLGRSWALAQLGDAQAAAQALRRAEELGADRRVVERQRAQLEQRGSGRAPDATADAALTQ